MIEILISFITYRCYYHLRCLPDLRYDCVTCTREDDCILDCRDIFSYLFP